MVCLLLVGCLLMESHPARAMDNARVETRTDLAVTKYGVSGQGVIVAIMDRGVDWKNNDFRNTDGTSRIQYIFDLTDDTGANAAGNTYGMGTIYTKAQIDTALSNGTNLATRDAVGHGTTTTGIACGNGRNSTNQKYRGIAPKADIIIVKIVSDGVPAHDGEAAESAFYKPERIPVAINFIRDKATALGKPCVMTLNIGSIGGPTDGTSELTRKIDATVGPGIPGLAYVNGTGDDGGMPNHAGGNVTQGGTVALKIQKGNAGSLYFDLWYPGTDRFDVSIKTPTATYGPYLSPATNNDYDLVSNSDFLYYHLGSTRVFLGAMNGKREIWMRLDGPVGTYTLTLKGATVSSGGRFDATINPSQEWNSASNANRFLNFVVPGSIWDGATSFHGICPNSYVIRNAYTDIDGVARQITGQGNVGELWKGSSVGPTFDGRLGMDVSAPADSVFTTYNPKSYWATFRFNLIQGGGGLYGRASAVSAANPMVTGIVALMLERDPQLDADTIKRLLQQTARQDSFTGIVPNPNWGYGKVDTYSAVSFTGQRKISGKVLLQECVNSAQPITFEFRPANGDPSFFRTLTLGSDGSFLLDHAPAGNFKIAVKGRKWLRSVVPVNTTNANVSGLSVSLLAGDVNNDNVVGLDDLGLLADAFDTLPSDTLWNSDADLNCDGVVGLDDLGLLALNFDTNGDP